MGAAAALPMAAAGGLSLASMGMKAGSDVAAGYATQQQDEVKAKNALLQGQTQATNYRFAGQQQKDQFGIESSRDLMQAGQADTAADFGKLQADMTDAAARDKLVTTLGNISVIRAAGGADLTSPTTAALQGHVTNIAEMNREAAVGSINAQTAQQKAAADYLRQASAFALTQGQRAGEMGEFNAQTALTYGNYNASAARAAGDSAVDIGFMNAGSDILGGLGKAFASGGGMGGDGASGGKSVG